MDITGSYWSSLIFMSTAFFVAAGFILPLRETGKGRNKEEAG
jgi:hypothetical protein